MPTKYPIPTSYIISRNCWQTSILTCYSFSYSWHWSGGADSQAALGRKSSKRPEAANITTQKHNNGCLLLICTCSRWRNLTRNSTNWMGITQHSPIVCLSFTTFVVFTLFQLSMYHRFRSSTGWHIFTYTYFILHFNLALFGMYEFDSLFGITSNQ